MLGSLVMFFLLLGIKEGLHSPGPVRLSPLRKKAKYAVFFKCKIETQIAMRELLAKQKAAKLLEERARKP